MALVRTCRLLRAETQPLFVAHRFLRMECLPEVDSQSLLGKHASAVVHWLDALLSSRDISKDNLYVTLYGHESDTPREIAVDFFAYKGRKHVVHQPRLYDNDFDRHSKLKEFSQSLDAFDPFEGKALEEGDVRELFAILAGEDSR